MPTAPLQVGPRFHQVAEHPNVVELPGEQGPLILEERQEVDAVGFIPDTRAPPTPAVTAARSSFCSSAARCPAVVTLMYAC